jgi:hypothetical protein
MILANPIYDSVFKYLLDDNEVAKILISNILDIKIDSLQFEPTEIILPAGKRDYTVFRIDFKATITLPTQEKQVILIEIVYCQNKISILNSFFNKSAANNRANPIVIKKNT